MVKFSVYERKLTLFIFVKIMAEHKNTFSIGFVGDIHGDFDIIKENVKKYNIEASVLFQVGDMGIGFGEYTAKKKKILADLNKFLRDRNIILYVVKGNHDNPKFFDGSHNRSNIILMKDYDVVDVWIGEEKRRVLGVGGAISVDKDACDDVVDFEGNSWPGLTEGVNWWSEEKFILNKEKISKLKDVDVVVTHTCPDITNSNLIESHIAKWTKNNPTLKKALKKEHAQMSEMYRLLEKNNNITTWVFGHLHHSKKEKIGKTKFILLGINEFYSLYL